MNTDQDQNQPGTGWPCPCWIEPSLHSGHCCMQIPYFDYTAADPLPCGHEDLGRQRMFEHEAAKARDRRVCRGVANICVAEGCYAAACTELGNR